MKSAIAVTLLAALIASNGCTRNSTPTPDKARLQEAQVPPRRTISDIARDSLKSVVTIVTTDAAGGTLEQGSGFIVSSDGKIVTNHHVIAGADSAVVKLSDGGIYGVEGIVGDDKEKDVAVLKLKASGREFPFLPRGDSAQLRVGDEIVAIGSPLGLEGTVSTGVVSSKRTFPGSQLEVLQITAPISPGSSGGALLNSKGEVVGVPFVQMVGGQNLNFAIPITNVLPLLVDAPAKPFPSVPPPVVAKKSPPKQSARTPAVKPGADWFAENAPHETPQPKPPPKNTEQLPQVAKTATANPSELSGNYTGMWQSTVFAASGAAVMTVSSEGKTVHAEIGLTGGQVIRETLTGEAAEVGGGWSVTLKSASGNLYATGIFKKGAFEGDYDYTPASDHGRWGLKKD
jgi:S1-C subfamily serine protease